MYTKNCVPIMLNSWSCTVYVLFILFDLCFAQESCYPPGGVAGIVVATIIVTFVVGGLGAAVAFKLWTRKKGESFFLFTTRIFFRHRCLPV